MDRSEVVDALAQLSWHVQATTSDAAARHDVSSSQLRLLGILRDREPEMLELARHLRLDKSSVTGLVTRAAARGLVERVPSETDGRRIVVRLTPAGRALATELEGDVERGLAPWIDAMTDSERASLVGFVERRREAQWLSGSTTS